MSGGSGPGTSALFVNGSVRRSGATGIAFTGDIELETVVAKACRPVGRPMVVTEASENMILKLDGEKALPCLQSVFRAATPESKSLIRRSVQIGILSQVAGEPDESSEYVIRNVLGMIEETGAVAIGDTVREGQVVQFHVSDAQTAEQDLRASLEDYVSDDYRIPSSALMFSCLSLGKRLHGQPDHAQDEDGQNSRLVGQCDGLLGRGHVMASVFHRTLLFRLTYAVILSLAGRACGRRPNPARSNPRFFLILRSLPGPATTAPRARTWNRAGDAVGPFARGYP